MGLFRKGRSRSQSTASIAQQHFALPDVDNDVQLLHGGDHVYLTHTKNGKPALGRKKPGKLLPDFDILSQTFGIPSRYEFEKRARASSAISQSSGLVTAPVTPRRGRGTRINDNSPDENQAIESPALRRKASSIRSSSTPAPIAMRQHDNQNDSNSNRPATAGFSSSFSTPGALGQVPMLRQVAAAAPPPPPPPPSATGWQNNPATNSGMVPIPLDYYGSACQYTHLPGYSFNGAMMVPGASNWAGSQYHVPAQPPNPLGNSLHQAAAIPIPPYHEQFFQPQPPYVSYMQAAPSAHSVNMSSRVPAPPPPPSQDWLQKFAVNTGHSKKPHRHPDLGGHTEKFVERADQGRKSSSDLGQTQDKSKESKGVRSNLSGRIHHVHVCGGCGTTRSRRYHRSHPLKRGEIPAPNYCYKCLKTAAETNFESSDEDSVGDRATEKVYTQTDKSHKKANAPSSSTDDDNDITEDKYMFKQTSHGHRRIKKSGPLSGLSSRERDDSASTQSPMPISSDEESRSEDSSVPSSRYETRSIPRPRGRRSYERIHKVTPNATPDLTQSESDENMRNKRHTPPSLTIEVESEVAKNEPHSIQGTSSDKPRFDRSPIRTRSRARARQLRPRLRSQSMPVDSDCCSLPPSARVETAQKPSYPIDPNQKQAAVAQMDAQDSTNQGVKKNRVSPLEKVNSVDSLPMDASDTSNGKQASMNRLRKRVNAGPEVISKGSADDLMGKAGSSFPRSESPIPSNHESETDPRSGRSHQTSTAKNDEGQPLDGDAPEEAQVPDTVFGWDEPVTPVDAPYADASYFPQVASDFWPDYQEHTEQAAEEMAEKELASAHKVFNGFSSTFGSTSSARPISSFLASELSIESYYSDSDHNDSDHSTTGIGGTRAMGTRGRPVKQIEFSSENDQNSKLGILSPLNEPSQGRVLFDVLGDGQNSDIDVVYFTSPVESSIIGHTGHSVDDLATRTSTGGGVATTAKGHGSWRLMRFFTA